MSGQDRSKSLPVKRPSNGGTSGATQSKNGGPSSRAVPSTAVAGPSAAGGPSSTSTPQRTFRRASSGRSPESDEALAKQMDVVTDEMRKLRRIVLEREQQSSFAASPRLSPVQRSSTRTSDDTVKDFTDEFRNLVELLKNLPPGDPYVPRVVISPPAASPPGGRVEDSSRRSGDPNVPAFGIASVSRDLGTPGATPRRYDDPESVLHGSMKDVDELERSFFEEAFSREMVRQSRKLLAEQEKVEMTSNEDLGRLFKRLLEEKEQKVHKMSDEEMGRQYRRLLSEHEPLHRIPDEGTRTSGKQTKGSTAAAASSSASPLSAAPKALPPRSPRPEAHVQTAKNISSPAGGRRSPAQRKGSPLTDEGKKHADLPLWKR